MLKKVIAIVTVIFFALNLASCVGKTAVSKKTIQEDIGNHESIKFCYYSGYVANDDFGLKQFEIDKRQTNLEKKEDIVFSTVTVENSYFNVELSVKSLYNYYDEGGWILDELEILKENVKPINPPDCESIIKDYNDKLLNSESKELLYIINEDILKQSSASERLNTRHYNFKSKVEFIDCIFENSTAVIKVFAESSTYKVYGNINLNFNQATGWTVENVYYDEEEEKSENYIELTNIDFDYKKALGDYYYFPYDSYGSTETYFTLKIIDITENTIEYEYIAPKDIILAGCENNIDHDTVEFDGVVGCLLANYDTLKYDYENNTWKTGRAVFK